MVHARLTNVMRERSVPSANVVCALYKDQLRALAEESHGTAK